MSVPLLLAAYCFFIVLASLFGGWLPSLIRLTHVRMQTMMSLVSGVMLGIAMLHMVPHAIEHLAPVNVAAAMLAGMLVMFFLLRLFHVHGHGGADHDACELLRAFRNGGAGRPKLVALVG
jgi:zinc and cadmium transporter